MTGNLVRDLCYFIAVSKIITENTCVYILHILLTVSQWLFFASVLKDYCCMKYVSIKSLTGVCTNYICSFGYSVAGQLMHGLLKDVGNQATNECPTGASFEGEGGAAIAPP